VTITNGYTTLADIKSRADIATADATIDSLLEGYVEAASRLIDGETQRTFYARTETHYFDIPKGRELRLDDDLLTITSVTNGDGTAIASTNYITVPKNHAPYYAIKLTEASTVGWSLNSYGNSEAVIAVAGTWGRSSTAPADIKEACAQIAHSALKRRFGENLSSISMVTAAGVVITPQDIPAFAWRVIRRYRRMA